MDKIYPIEKTQHRGEITKIQIIAVHKCRFRELDDIWTHIADKGNLSLTHWWRVYIDFSQRIIQFRNLNWGVFSLFLDIYNRFRITRTGCIKLGT